MFMYFNTYKNKDIEINRIELFKIKHYNKLLVFFSLPLFKF